MIAPDLSTRLAAARSALDAAGQGHVLCFFDRLDDAQLRSLLDQIDSVDWPEVARLVQSYVLSKPKFALPTNLQPAPWYPYKPTPELADKYRRAREHGISLIRAGKTAAFTVAGGQGTRLGWDAPKGTFPATPVRKLPLFAAMAEYILKTQQKYRCVVPWYIMTSPINDAPTRDFFRQHSHFALDPANVMFFPQAMMPAFDLASGKVLLESPGSIALSPNGHGGSLKALHASGAIADMQDRGVEEICYTQIDNPIVKVVDPIFIGLHALDRCQMSSKMLPKSGPMEKLGNFCLVDGKITVIEYSDLPNDLAQERLPTGQLRFLAGSIAIHMIRVDFVVAINSGGPTGGFSMPFHRAEKKVACINLETGGPIRPDKPNAVKLETFVFDALPMCDKSIIYETDRSEEFAPIKNADEPGKVVVDSPASSRQIQCERAARWLAAHHVAVPRKPDGSLDAVVEISQLTAIEPDDLKGVKFPAKIAPGAQVLI